MKSVVAAMACVVTGFVGVSSATAQNDGTMEIKMDGLEHVAVETNVGTFILALDSEKAPITTENFLQYVEDDFYNGTIFHRVIPGFMIQGGGFTDGLVQKETRAPIKNEWKNGLKNNRGTISMARLSNPDSGSSQFFINVVDNPSLDTPRPQTGNAAYAVFGEVVAGMDVIDTIRYTPTKVAVPAAGGGQMGDVPTENMTIIDAHRVSDEQAEMMKPELEAKNAEKIKAWNEQLAVRAAERRAAQSKAMEAELEKAEQVIAGLGVDVNGATKTDDGLWMLDEVTGTGETAQPGEMVVCHYDLYLTNGKLIQSSKTRGQTARFSLNQVIEAWKEGIPGMAVGGTRWLIAPPDMAYGSGGTPGIPPNSTLIFRVELHDRIAP